MPIYEYQATHETESCLSCVNVFEVIQRITEPSLKECPHCGAPLTKLISAHAVGSSQAGFDDRAKAAGFHKLEKRNQGEYEKKY